MIHEIAESKLLNAIIVDNPCVDIITVDMDYTPGIEEDGGMATLTPIPSKTRIQLGSFVQQEGFNDEDFLSHLEKMYVDKVVEISQETMGVQHFTPTHVYRQIANTIIALGRNIITEGRMGKATFVVMPSFLVRILFTENYGTFRAKQTIGDMDATYPVHCGTKLGMEVFAYDGMGRQILVGRSGRPSEPGVHNFVYNDPRDSDEIVLFASAKVGSAAGQQFASCAYSLR